MRTLPHALLAVVTVGCAGEFGSGAAATPVEAPSDARASAAMCGRAFTAAELQAHATAPDDAIAVQLDSAPTFGFAPSFARLPIFTLYRDGSVFYPKDDRRFGTLLTAKLPTAEVQAIVARVLDLGFTRLQSHVDECSCPTPNSIMICTSDASYTILRVRLSSGELRSVAVYASQWNETDTAKAIIDYLTKYRAPNAETYVPEKATLIADRIEKRDDCVSVETTLDAELARVPATPTEKRSLPVGANARPVSGGVLRAVLAKVGAGGGMSTLCSPANAYRTRVIPWLPGANLAPAIERWLERRGYLERE